MLSKISHKFASEIAVKSKKIAVGSRAPPDLLGELTISLTVVDRQTLSLT